MRYVIGAIEDLSKRLAGRARHSSYIYSAVCKSLAPIGSQGVSMIAVSGVDMAAREALAKAANRLLCNLLGGRVGER